MIRLRPRPATRPVVTSPDPTRANLELRATIAAHRARIGAPPR